MKRLVLILFLSGCGGTEYNADDMSCVGNLATVQATAIVDECKNKFPDPFDCVREVARQRILISIEYAKNCPDGGK